MSGFEALALREPDRPFDVQGHRGARGLLPENTLAGIACALEIGVGSVECDVALSVDDVVILSHDGAVLHRVALGARSTSQTPARRPPLVEFPRLGVGCGDPEGLSAVRGEPVQRVTTLGSVLALFELFEAGDVRLDVEVKSAGHSDPRSDPAHVVERVVAVIRAHGAVQTCSLRSFDMQVQHQALQQCSELSRTLLVGTAADQVPVDLAMDAAVTATEILGLASEIAAAAVAPGRSLVTPELIERAHARGLPVIPWTVNDPASVRELLAIGVDGICTDRPDVLRKTLAEDGWPLPAPLRAPGWLRHGWQAWPNQSPARDAS